VQRSDHDVKRHPQDEQPARPTPSLEQKRAAGHRRNCRKINHPMMFEICEALVGVDQIPRGMDQRQHAEQDKEESDYDDRYGESLHAEETNVTVFVCKATCRRPGPATICVGGGYEIRIEFNVVAAVSVGRECVCAGD